MKKPKHSDIDLDNWRDYLEDGITTNSRWLSNFNDKPMYGHFLIPKRENLPKIPKDIEHHGLWIPEIPYQMIIRFSKKDDNIWSIFGGTGIDYDIAKYLGRNCTINDIIPKRDFIIKADTRTYNPDKSFKMILAHPPYWDIVKYSEDDISDGSTMKSLDEFLLWWSEILDNVDKYLEKDGYFILVCGNVYKNSEEIELGEILKNMVLNQGYTLKQHIIKDYGETKGTEAKNYNINYYRQLKGGYGNFYGDNIYILKKRKSRNNICSLISKYIK